MDCLHKKRIPALLMSGLLCLSLLAGCGGEEETDVDVDVEDGQVEVEVEKDDDDTAADEVEDAAEEAEEAAAEADPVTDETWSALLENMAVVGKQLTAVGESEGEMAPALSDNIIPISKRMSEIAIDFSDREREDYSEAEAAGILEEVTTCREFLSQYVELP